MKWDTYFVLCLAQWWDYSVHSGLWLSSNILWLLHAWHYWTDRNTFIYISPTSLFSSWSHVSHLSGKHMGGNTDKCVCVYLCEPLAFLHLLCFILGEYSNQLWGLPTRENNHENRTSIYNLSPTVQLITRQPTGLLKLKSNYSCHSEYRAREWKKKRERRLEGEN